MLARLHQRRGVQSLEGLCGRDVSAVRIIAIAVDHVDDCRFSIRVLQFSTYLRSDRLGLLRSRLLARIDQLIPISVPFSLAEARHLD